MVVVVRCSLFSASTFGRLITSFLMGNSLPLPNNQQQDNEPPPPPPPQPPEDNHSSSTTTTPKTQTSTCEICIEPMQFPIVQKFKFHIHCDHPFCSECMIKYICAKLDDNIGKIPCPALDCNQFLDPLTCQPLIDPNVFVRWCDVLCESSVMELERSYCPNRNCSALIVNECGGRRRGKKATCPNCKTPFCFRCMLPWHGVLGCDESREFRESCDLEFGILAKNKGWIRCPRCRHFVERVNGCRIINCRCRAQFCYVCGVQVRGHWCKCQGFNRMLWFWMCMALLVFLFAGEVVRKNFTRETFELLREKERKGTSPIYAHQVFVGFQNRLKARSQWEERIVLILKVQSFEKVVVEESRWCYSSS